MRIIGGNFKGRRLKTPKRSTTRPTPDKVREALFNIIRDKVIDCIFVDLFAGSGAVGLEALSRGAKFAIFIEKNFYVCKIIKQNLKTLGIPDNKSLVICDDSISGLKKLEKKGYDFDIIFIDPPYYEKQIEPCLNFMRSGNLLTPSSIIILQYPKDDIVDINGFTKIKEKRYGRNMLSFITRSENF